MAKLYKKSKVKIVSKNSEKALDKLTQMWYTK